MYRRPKFLEIMDEIREGMSREADYDVDLFAEMVRNGRGTSEPSKLLLKREDEIHEAIRVELSDTEK